MKLKPSAVTYRFEHPNGYNFTVEAVEDREFGGWSANVVMATHNSRTPEGAVKHLALAAAEFARQAKALKDGDE